MKEKGWVWAKKAGNIGFMVATTSIVVLMPLIFEIMREGQVRDNSFNIIDVYVYVYVYSNDLIYIDF